MIDHPRHRTAAQGGSDAGRGRTAGRMFPGDEELGKRDDEYRPRQASSWSALWTTRMRYRKRRVAAVLAIGAFLFVLMRWMPSMDTDSGDILDHAVHDELPDGNTYNEPEHHIGVVAAKEPKGRPPREFGQNLGNEQDKDRTYNGNIKFYKLADSLRDVSMRSGLQFGTHVLFSASNFESVTKLIPLACEMGTVGKNHVHFTINGRETTTLESILEINGASGNACNVFWHDARPDYAQYSSDKRSEAAAAAALGHFTTYMNQKVVITDDLLLEESTFARGTKQKCKDLNIPIIELPKGASERLTWLAHLDVGALAAWNQHSVDILINGRTGSSGSLIRLLKSLTKADYSGLKPPRLIVDLPPDTDASVLAYLDNMKWPPKSSLPGLSAESSNQIILRHRLAEEKISPVQASVKFLESFYPSNLMRSHVLVLSPQVQLSPIYFYYVQYVLLTYLDSLVSDIPNHLFGFSLETPTTFLNGSTGFQLPTTKDMHFDDSEKSDVTSNVPFLWEAPQHNAALFVGSKWKEFHTFLAYRVAAQQQKAKDPEKIVSHEYPAWISYALEFMRTRGYFMHYPGLVADGSIATAQSEKPQIPEEFQDEMKPKTPQPHNTKPKTPDLKALESDLETSVPSRHPSEESSLIPDSQSLHSILPLNANLPMLSKLPILTYDGEKVPNPRHYLNGVEAYAAKFRKTIGSCGPAPSGKRRKIVSGDTKDLFCFGDEGEDDFEDVPAEGGGGDAADPESVEAELGKETSDGV